MRKDMKGNDDESMAEQFGEAISLMMENLGQQLSQYEN
jgi:hypothetical protein